MEKSRFLRWPLGGQGLCSWKRFEKDREVQTETLLCPASSVTTPRHWAEGHPSSSGHTACGQQCGCSRMPRSDHGTSWPVFFSVIPRCA